MFYSEVLTDNKVKWWLLSGCSLMLLMINLDVTIVNLALASINQQFHVSLLALQWVITSYAVVAAIGFIVVGKISSQNNLKKVFLTGTTLFVVGSMLCGLAPTFNLLILGRIIQAFGLASTLNIALLIVKKVFPQEQQAFAIGCCTIMTGFAIAVGPTLGGWIIALLNWRWIFFINLPFAILSFCLIYTLLEKDNEGINWRNINGMSVVLLSISFLLLVISLASIHQASALTIIVYFLLTLCSFILLISHSKKNPQALLDMTLFKNKKYCLNLGIRAFTMMTWSSLLFCLPLYLQNAMSYSSLKTGNIMLCMMVLFIIASPLCGKIIDKTTAVKPMFIMSIVGSLISLLLLFIIKNHVNLIIYPLFLFGVIFAALIVGTIHQSYAVLPHEKLTIGMGTFFSVAFLSVTIGVTLTTLILSLIPILSGIPSLSLSHSLVLSFQNNNKVFAVFPFTMQMVFLFNTLLFILSGILSLFLFDRKD